MKSATIYRPLVVSGLLLVAAGVRADVGPIDVGGDANAGAHVGAALASAGDFDGDGREDLVVGAPDLSVALPGQGGVYLFKGLAGGGFGSSVLLGAGAITNGHLGASVTGRCDLNGDGTSDVAVGAPGTTATSAAAFVYFGPDGMKSTPLSGPDGSGFGTSVVCLPNFAGDRRAWLMVGAPRADANGAVGAGKVYLFTFKPDGSIDQKLEVSGELANERCGTGVAALPPDANGVSRVIAGCPGFVANNLSVGRLLMFDFINGGHGSTRSISGVSGAGSGFGTHVHAIGDFDGDRRPDIAVAAPSARLGAGEVVVYTVDPLGLAPLGAPFSVTAATGLGRGLAPAGDVNGDGFADVLVGTDQVIDATLMVSHEAVFVLHGGPATSRAPPRLVLSPTPGVEGFGQAVAGVGDVNGDGFADLAVGAPKQNVTPTMSGPTFPEAGGVRFFLGTARGPASVFLPISLTTSSRPESLAGAGDVNGDGLDELLLGQPRLTGGDVSVLMGTSDPTAFSSVTLRRSENRFGESVASAGDVNGDGYGDIVVGAPDAGNGVVFLFLGSKDGLLTAPAWQATHDELGARFGASVAAAGDVDGDGYDDVVVGAPGAGANGTLTSAGAVFIYRGGPDGLSAEPAFFARGTGNEQLGASVAGAGDFDRDGRADVVAGAPAQLLTVDSSAYVFGLGAAPSQELFELGRVSGGPQLGAVGARVSGGQDIDGDGSSDVVVSGQPTGGPPLAIVLFGVARGAVARMPWVSPPLPGTVTLRAAVDVAGVGDVDGDHLGDVLLGSSDVDAGAVLYLGRASGQLQLASWRPGDPASSLGATVAAGGDLNRDGFNDLLVSAPDVPQVRVFAGGDLTPGRRYDLTQTFDGTQRGHGFAAKADVSVVLTATLRDEVAALAPLSLEVEVRPVGTPFTGARTSTSAAPTAPGVLAVTLPPLESGRRYHWQARVVANGRAGRWRSFAADDESRTDFSVGLAIDVGRDAGVEPQDAGVDAGAGTQDAGVDGGAADGGTGPVVFDAVGCNCGTLPLAPSVALLLALLAQRARRRRG